MNSKILCLSLRLLLAVIALSCFKGPGFMTQKNAANITVVETTESDGAISGTISAKSNTTQEINSNSGALAGSSVQFPPGSLAISTDVTVEEGASIANDANSSSLGINSSVNSASPAMVVSSSTEQDPANPFTLQIPVSSSASLALTATTYYVVIFKAVKYSDGGKVLIGVIPHAAISVDNGKAKFNVKYFGVYQVAKVDTLIEQAKEVESNAPILTKREEKKLPQISWSKLTLSNNSTTRSVSISGTLANAPIIKGCVLLADQDKTFPWDHKKDINQPTTEFSPPSTNEHNYYFRFICGFSDGRTSESEWSDLFKFNAVSISIAGIPSSAIDAGTEFEISASGDGVKEYKYAISKGSTVDCANLTYSGWISITPKIKIKSADSGQITLCIKAKDYANNETASANSYSWTQNAKSTTPPDNAITLNTNYNPSLLSGCYFSQYGAATFLSGYEYASSTVSVSGINLVPLSSNAHQGGFSFTLDVNDMTFNKVFNAVWTVNGSSSSSKSATVNYIIKSSDITDFFRVPYLYGIGIFNADHPMVGLQAAEISPACKQVGYLASIGTGQNHTCIVEVDGGIYCWGMGTYGELGQGVAATSTFPVNSQGITGGGLAIAVSGGYHHTCALLNDFEMKCWGEAANGRLGHGYMSPNEFAPVFVLSSGTNQSVNHFNSVVALAVGYDHTCALKNNGAVYCWGYNGLSQVGQSNGTISFINPQLTELDASVSAKTAVAIASGQSFSCAILTASESNRIKCWGEQEFGRLGNEASVAGSVWNPFPFVKIDAATELSGAVGIAAGNKHACALLNTGKIRCWGYNGFGALGVGDAVNKSRADTDVTGIGGTNPKAVAIACGGHHTCAIIEDGTLKCWGSNSDGQLGDGTISNRFTPTTVAIPGTKKIVAVEGGDLHTCAIADNERVYCFGDMGYVGTGTASDQLNAASVLQSAGGPEFTGVGVIRKMIVNKQ